MNCSICQTTVGVINSRKKPYGRYRRYRCYKCGYRFSTMEVKLEKGERTMVVLYALGLIRGHISAQELTPTRRTARGRRTAR